MSADLSRVFETGEQVKRWAAERENASARLELSKVHNAAATLLSRGDPVSHLGMNREHLRVLLAFLWHNDLPRLLREVANVAPEPVSPVQISSQDPPTRSGFVNGTGSRAADRADRYETALRLLLKYIEERDVTFTSGIARPIITEALNHADK